MVILQEPQEDLEVVVGIAVMQLEIPLLLVHLKAVMVEMEVATEKAVKIIDIYTHKVEKRLDRLGTYLVFIVIPLLLIIAMQLGTLLIYIISQS